MPVWTAMNWTGHGLVAVEADDGPMGLHCIIFLVLYKLDLFHNQSCF